MILAIIVVPIMHPVIHRFRYIIKYLAAYAHIKGQINNLIIKYTNHG